MLTATPFDVHYPNCVGDSIVARQAGPNLRVTIRRTPLPGSTAIVLQTLYITLAYLRVDTHAQKVVGWGDTEYLKSTRDPSTQNASGTISTNIDVVLLENMPITSHLTK